MKKEDTLARLVLFDVLVLRAWALALSKIHMISVTEFDDIHAALEKIGSDVEKHPELVAGLLPRNAREYANNRAQEALGPLWEKCRQGLGDRERDLVTFRLWMVDAGAHCRVAIDELICSLLRLARQSREFVIFPPNCELTEPVLFGHWLLGQIEALLRDSGRMRDILDRSDECALGSGGGGGAALPVDREVLAGELGFARATENCHDSLHNLEFAWELASATNVAMTHVQSIRDGCAALTNERAWSAGTAPREAQAGQGAAVQTYFFDLLNEFHEFVKSTAAWIDKITIHDQLLKLSDVDAAVRASIESRKCLGGTHPDVVERRLAVLEARYPEMDNG